MTQKNIDVHAELNKINEMSFELRVAFDEIVEYFENADRLNADYPFNVSLFMDDFRPVANKIQEADDSILDLCQKYKIPINKH